MGLKHPAWEVKKLSRHPEMVWALLKSRSALQQEGYGGGSRGAVPTAAGISACCSLPSTWPGASASPSFLPGTPERWAQLICKHHGAFYDG